MKILICEIKDIEMEDRDIIEMFSGPGAVNAGAKWMANNIRGFVDDEKYPEIYESLEKATTVKQVVDLMNTWCLDFGGREDWCFGWREVTYAK